MEQIGSVGDRLKKILGIFILTLIFGIAYAAKIIDADQIKSADHTKTWTMPAATGTLSTLANAESLSNKTLVTPTIASFVNATHTHENAAGGGQISLTNAVTGTLPVASGGTGITSGTSGGVLAFTAAGTIASSGALAANQVVIGGGAGAAPSTLAAGSQYQSLTMGASNPGWGAVDLSQSAAVTGTLGVTKGGTGLATIASTAVPFASAADTLTADASKLSFVTASNRFYVGAVGLATAQLNSNATSASNFALYTAHTANDVNVFRSQSTYTNTYMQHADNTAANGLLFNIGRSRGTTSSRTQTMSGDLLGAILFNGYTSSSAFGTVGAASIKAYTAEDQTAAAQGGELRFLTTPTGTITPKERLRIMQDGSLQLAGNTSGYVAIIPTAATTSYTLTLPSAQGASNTVLRNDGSGGLTWATQAAGVDQSYEISNCTLTASVAASALTVALKTKAGADPSAGSPCLIGFRSATAATGTYEQVSVTSALSVVASSGSTLGSTSAQPFYVYVYAINSGSGAVLGLQGLGPTLDEGSVASSTAEGGAGAADSSGTVYSTAAQTSKPVRLIGRILMTQATAGTWASTATEIALAPFRKRTFPTIQKFTSGSGTYTTPAGVAYIRVRAVGGGGGGSGSSTSAANNGNVGGDGGATYFGTSLISANGGSGGGATSGANGGTGGTASLGTGPIGTALSGANGSSVVEGQGVLTTYAFKGTDGAASAFGGAGRGGLPGANAGGAGVTNTGGGGGGAGAPAGGITGSGGGAGGFVDAIITSPNSSYAYTVGAAGAAGATGTGGAAGGAGGSGYIEVTEYYQ